MSPGDTPVDHLAQPGEAPPATPPGGIRERVMQAALDCMESGGVDGFSLEDVARGCGVSRTSIYRHFPGGRSQLVQETVAWEVARFWTRVAEAVAHLDSLEDRLVHGLAVGAELMRGSRLMANLNDLDIEELAHALRPSEPLIHSVMDDYMREMLERERAAGRVRPGVDLRESADYLTRMILSMMASPAGVDLTDPEQARAVVRREFLAGIMVGYLH
jgi:AcrR family transcriptional regulator